MLVGLVLLVLLLVGIPRTVSIALISASIRATEISIGVSELRRYFTPSIKPPSRKLY